MVGAFKCYFRVYDAIGRTNIHDSCDRREQTRERHEIAAPTKKTDEEDRKRLQCGANCCGIFIRCWIAVLLIVVGLMLWSVKKVQSKSNNYCSLLFRVNYFNLHVQCKIIGGVSSLHAWGGRRNNWTIYHVFGCLRGQKCWMNIYIVCGLIKSTSLSELLSIKTNKASVNAVNKCEKKLVFSHANGMWVITVFFLYKWKFS